MPTSPNLQITHVEESQNAKEVTVNEAIDLLDGALTAHDAANWDFPSDANYTPTPADCLASFSFDCVSTFGSLTATRDVIVPDNPKTYLVKNSTTGAQSIVVKTAAGTGITIVTTAQTLLYCDGTNVVAI